MDSTVGKTLHRYVIPIVKLDEKDSPRTRRKLREMGRPLREGCIKFGEHARAAWPHGSLVYFARSYTDDDGKTRYVTAALPARFHAGIMEWITEEERTLLPSGIDGMTVEA